MNQDIFTGQWKQMQGELKSWWGKLADSDFDRIGGQKDKLVGVVQEKYGYAREQAQQEVDRRLQEYSDKMGGPNSSGKRDAAEAVSGMSAMAQKPGAPTARKASEATTVAGAERGAPAGGMPDNAPHEGMIATAMAAVAGGLESAEGALATATTAIADGLGSAEGALATATTAVADGLGSATAYLQEKEFAAMAADLTALMRRYPVQSLLVGVGLGYVLSRLTTR